MPLLPQFIKNTYKCCVLTLNLWQESGRKRHFLWQEPVARAGEIGKIGEDMTGAGESRRATLFVLPYFRS